MLPVIFFTVVVLGGITYYFKINIFIIMKLLKDKLLLAYSTASSETVLPRMMDKLTQYGVPSSITSFVVPIGYSFNLDASTFYQSIAENGIELSLMQEIIL